MLTTKGGGAFAKDAAPPRWRKFALVAKSKAVVPHSPPGYDTNQAVVVVSKLPAKELAAMKLKAQDAQCMAIARAPFTQIFMIAFMCWITGASLHIFSIMQLFMVFQTAINSIINTPDAFKAVGHPNPTMYVCM